ncbi:hypothetical protein BGZ95_008548, partial [Linnemannia exigua]
LTTPSYVRIVKFLDGTQETKLGKDAIDRPLDEREMAAVRARRAELDQRYRDNPGSNYNSSIPDPEFKGGFQPNKAYGLGWPPSFTVKETIYDPWGDEMDWGLSLGSTSALSLGSQSRRKRQYFEFEEGLGMGGEFDFEFGGIGSEWDDGLTKPIRTSYHGDYNATAQCVRTPEELDRMENERRKTYELRQTVAKILLERAKDMAETRLDTKV